MKEFGAEEIEKQLAIKDVMEYAVRITRAVQLAKQMESYKSRPVLLGLLAIPSLILFLYSYFARPDWVYGADPVRMSAPRRVAYTRLAMYLAAQQVESFRVTNGVLPGSLAELGEDWAGMSYQPLSATTFELSAPGQGGALVYRSDTPIGEFLGNSVPFLRNRGP